MNGAHFQSLNFSLWAGIPCESINPSIGTILLTIKPSRGRIQLLCDCSLCFPNAPDC